jgi:hypothetical protein
VRVLLWFANILLAAVSALALVHVGTVVNGRGTGVRVMKLQVDGVLDYEKAREKYPQWRDDDMFEGIGRFVAHHHITAEGILAATGLSVAVVNMFGLRSKYA